MKNKYYLFAWAIDKFMGHYNEYVHLYEYIQYCLPLLNEKYYELLMF